MKLNRLPKITRRKKKRAGRGYGSGKGGHTVGRGAKGSKARNKLPLTFEGTKIKKSFLKRLPLRRGKGRFKSLRPGPLVVNVHLLNLLPKGSVVEIDTLVKQGMVNQDEAKKFGVKILGEGELKIPLTVSLPCSQGAVKKIEKAGGKVAMEKLKKEKEKPKKTEKKSEKADQKGAQSQPKPKAEKVKPKKESKRKS
jgi:large subunit ribosomal protein L15